MKKIHRFIADILVNDNIASLQDEEVVHQLRDVLKLHIGEEVAFCDGKGNEWTGELQGISKTSAELLVTGTFSGTDPVAHDVHLYLSILKNEHFELAIQKAVECGVKEITPLISKRTIKLQIKPERIRRIIREAAEQSGRLQLPTLHEMCSFEQALINWSGQHERAVFFDVDGVPLRNVPPSKEPALSVFIGPEGGWDQSEIDAAKRAKMVIASLGPFVLRAETAATIATFLLAQ